MGFRALEPDTALGGVQENLKFDLIFHLTINGLITIFGNVLKTELGMMTDFCQSFLLNRNKNYL